MPVDGSVPPSRTRHGPRRRCAPRVDAKTLSLDMTRAQGRPGARRTHGPACNKKHAVRTTGVAGIIRPSLRNGFNGVLRALPGDEFLFVTVAPRIEGFARPVGPPKPPRDLTPATDARTTRLHRPQHCRSSRALPIAHEKIALRSHQARTTSSRPPHPIPTSVTIAIRPSCRG